MAYANKGPFSNSQDDSKTELLPFENGLSKMFGNRMAFGFPSSVFEPLLYSTEIVWTLGIRGGAFSIHPFKQDSQATFCETYLSF